MEKYRFAKCVINEQLMKYDLMYTFDKKSDDIFNCIEQLQKVLKLIDIDNNEIIINDNFINEQIKLKYRNKKTFCIDNNIERRTVNIYTINLIKKIEQSKIFLNKIGFDIKIIKYEK